MYCGLVQAGQVEQVYVQRSFTRKYYIIRSFQLHIVHRV